MNFKVAIKTYKRTQVLKEKTLVMLAEAGIPDEEITLFVVNDDEEQAYRDALPGPGYNYVQCGPGINNAVRAYRSHFPAGTRVLHVDDDIAALMKKTGENQLSQVTNLVEYVDQMFDITEANDSRMWGVYPVQNAFFMGEHVTQGLRFCCAVFQGFISDGGRDISLFPECGNKDDFELSIKLYLADGSVIRDEAVTVKTAYYTSNKGGTAGDGPELREKRHLDAANMLASRYPDHCSLVKKKGFGGLDIRLKRMPYVKLCLSPAQVAQEHAAT